MRTKYSLIILLWFIFASIIFGTFIIAGLLLEFEIKLSDDNLGTFENPVTFLVYTALVSCIIVLLLIPLSFTSQDDHLNRVDNLKAWGLCINSFVIAWMFCLFPIKTFHKELPLYRAFGLSVENDNKKPSDLLTAYLTSGLLTNNHIPDNQEPELLTDSEAYICSWTQDNGIENKNQNEFLGNSIFSIQQKSRTSATPIATKPSGLQKNVELRVGKTKKKPNESDDGYANILSILVKRISPLNNPHKDSNWLESGYALAIRRSRGITEENLLNNIHKLDVCVYTYGKRDSVKSPEILEPTGDWLPILTVFTPGYFTRLNTVSVHSDEEAIATWFLSIMDREEKIKEMDSQKNLPLELSPDDKKRLFRFIADSIRITLAGWKDSQPDEQILIKRPSELASELRWAAWIHGADPFGTRILFLIYWFGATAIVIFIIRLICFFPLRRKYIRFDSAKKCRDCKDSLGIFHGFADFLVYALPSIGFLGTIAGLGAAFGTVGIVSSVSEIQKMSLMDVLLNLGTAFSTTFFGLIAGLIASLCFMVNDIFEGQLFNKIDEYEASSKVPANGGLNAIS